MAINWLDRLNPFWSRHPVVKDWPRRQIFPERNFLITGFVILAWAYFRHRRMVNEAGGPSGKDPFYDHLRKRKEVAEEFSEADFMKEIDRLELESKSQGSKGDLVKK